MQQIVGHKLVAISWRVCHWIFHAICQPSHLEVYVQVNPCCTFSAFMMFTSVELPYYNCSHFSIYHSSNEIKYKNSQSLSLHLTSSILKQHNKAKQKSKDKAKMILYDNVSLYSNLCLRNVNQLPHFRYNTHFHNSIITNARRSKNKQNFAGAQGQHFLNSFKKPPQWLHLRL